MAPKFRFMDLPTELRLRIIDFTTLMGNPIAMPVFPKSATTCREFYDQSFSTYYGNNRFDFLLVQGDSGGFAFHEGDKDFLVFTPTGISRIRHWQLRVGLNNTDRDVLYVYAELSLSDATILYTQNIKYGPIRARASPTLLTFAKEKISPIFQSSEEGDICVDPPCATLQRIEELFDEHWEDWLAAANGVF
ncbi:hypothetical protein M8818_002244 [Zalaria obscura]|uniref:Uncharacterized protein n=1 Tax=Zalaria obscura TaxID=2024903 RepID=A0ACC3SI95_9PEZI